MQLLLFLAVNTFSFLQLVYSLIADFDFVQDIKDAF